MPPRRSHKKSRAGCRRCKNRKIKCDEVHPRCGNCVKHGVACDFEKPGSVNEEETTCSTPTPVVGSPPISTPAELYNSTTSPPQQQPLPLPLPPQQQQQQQHQQQQQPNGFQPPLSAQPVQPASPPLSSEASRVTPDPYGRPVDRLMELRIWHHFTSSTYKTLLTDGRPSTDAIWLHDVPQIGFAGCKYLADALLALAALHLRSECPDDKALVHASHAYSATALAEYRSTIHRGITADNAVPLFLTSSLIAIQAAASRIFIKDDGYATPNHRPGASRYTVPLAWFHAFQGVKTMTATSWMFLCNSRIVKAVIDSQPGFQLEMNPQGPNSFFGHLMDDLEEELANEGDQKATITNQAYYHAVSVLNWAHKSPYPPAPLAFASTVSRRFIELITERRPRALAVLACFFALLKRIGDVWWLGDVARREVMGLVSLFEAGSKWWRHLEWPIRIALWDGSEIPPEVWGVEVPEQSPGDKVLSDTMVTHIELLTKMKDVAPCSPASISDELGFDAVPLD